MAKSFVVCAKTDCKWNEDGVCAKNEIFVDNGVMCASYEPEMDPLAMMLGGGGIGDTPPMDPRQALLSQRMGGGGPAPPMGGSIGGPPTPGPGALEGGGPPSPLGPPRRF